MIKDKSGKLYSKLGLLLTSLFLVFLTNACGGGSTTPTPSLTVTPTTATVTVGDAAIAFTATLSNSSSAINWSLTGAGSIPSGATGSTVSYTPPTTGAAATATLTATAGSLTASATITINVPATINVVGKVLQFDGTPAAGVNVQIDDAASTTGTAISDGTGAFSISGVKAPYTLSVIPPTGTNAPQTWTAVTRVDPTVVVNPITGPSAFCASPAPGTLNVNFATPVAAGNTATVAFIAPGINHLELNSNVSGGAAAGATTQTLTVPFDTSLCQTTVTGKVVYIETDGSLNIIRTASTDATVTTGNTTTAAITQQTASTKSLKGAVTFPAGATTANAVIVFKVGGASLALGGLSKTVNSTTPTYEFAAPEIEGVELRSLVLAGTPGGTVVWRYSDVISTLPATANLSLPSLGATNQPSGAAGANATPTFTYTPVSDVNLYSVLLQNVGGTPTQWIGSTSGNSIKIPSLPAPARLDIGTATTPMQYQWAINSIKVRDGGDSDTMLDGRQVKKVYLGGFFGIFNPDVISGGSANTAQTNFTLP
ncbi:MAG: hypothetical protein KC422_17525 [Trueperaceae bacterium]|nr:hypothetical protein [Trueperaceae bacterium]